MDKWINITDKRPKDKQLCVIRTGSEGYFVGKYSRYYGGFVNDAVIFYNANVVQWVPLPPET